MQTFPDNIEPGASALGRGNPDYDLDQFSLLSIAISLKRIADALAPPEGRLGPVDHLNEVLHDFANNLYSSLINARN